MTGRMFAFVALAFLGGTWVHASPARAADDWLGPDKALHFGGSAALSFVGYRAASPWLERPALRCAAGASLALSAGVAKELWDAAGHGDPSWRDLTWDVVGTAAGAFIAWGLDQAFGRYPTFRTRDMRGLVVRF